MATDSANIPSQAPYQSLSGCMVRMFWTFGGNIILVICLLSIMRHGESPPTVADLIFWCIALAQISLYFVDMYFMDGQKVMGPVRPRRRFHFPVIFATTCLGAWLVVRTIVKFTAEDAALG